MFENVVSRKNTNAVKWDDAIKASNSEDVIALSVADMDFRTAPEIIENMVNFANHGIYGYSDISKGYLTSVKEWVQNHNNFELEEDWIVFSPRVIQAISMIIQRETQLNDHIVVQTPLYGPIQNAVKTNGRTLITNSLIFEDGDYVIDFDDLEEKLKNAKMFIVCSPHNPMGRVWNHEEIEKIISICKKHDVLILSDEVHADFVWDEAFVSYGTYFKDYENIIVCTSPGKTFNIPGIEASNIIIENESLRKRFKEELNKAGIHNPNYFVVPAVHSAYTLGNEWFLLVKEVIRKNKELSRTFINEQLEGFHVTKSSSSYMLWIDYRDSGINEDELKEILVNRAKVVVSLGSGFGSEGNGFFRINVALSEKMLKEALNRMKNEILQWRKENEK